MSTGEQGVPGLFGLSYTEKRERVAREAMRLARLDLEPVSPDGQRRGHRGQLELWLTAERVASVAAEVFAGHDITVELDSTKIEKGVHTSSWYWVHQPDHAERWESPRTAIAVMVDLSGELGATSASIACVTAARKCYTQELLGIRKASEPMREFEAAAEGTRESLERYTRWLLRIYMKRRGVSEAVALTQLISVVRGLDGGAPTFEGLLAPQVAQLAMVLLTRMPEAQYDPGAAPANMEAPEDQLPDMGVA